MRDVVEGGDFEGTCKFVEGSERKCGAVQLYDGGCGGEREEKDC